MNDLHGAHLGTTGDGAARKHRAQRIEHAHPLAQLPADGGFDVVHVAVAGNFHQCRHLHAAGLAHPPQIIALQVDQHDVFGAFLGMRLQACAQRSVFHGIFASGMGAGNRPRFQAAAGVETDQPFGRRTHDRPFIHLQKRRKRRGIFLHQPREQRCGRNRGAEFGLPATRQIDLEHIAGTDAGLDARDARQKNSRVVLMQDGDLRQSGDGGQRPRQVARHAVDQRVPAGFGHQHATPVVAVEQDGRRDAGQPGKGEIGIPGQPHAGLEQPAQLIRERAQPAAAKRQAVVEPGGAERLKLHRRMRLQSAQAIGSGDVRGVLRKRKQHVPAGVAAAEKQAGITLRIGRLKPDQIRPRLPGLQRPFPDLGRGQAVRDEGQARLKTSEPLVPPNPKLFLSAKSIFRSRAVLAQ